MHTQPKRMHRSEPTRPSRTIVTFDIPTALIAQAKLRFWWILAGCALVSSSVMQVGANQVHGLYAVAIGHMAYAITTLLIPRRLSSASALRMSYVTAAMDPMMLTAWLFVLGEQGVIIAGLYLFTAIGYGMRIGRKGVMHVCQAASLVTFTFALALTPYWHAHTLVWLSYAASIIAIPLYAANLMTKLSAALRLADEESQAKSRLLARVSHELRTPLGGMTNAAELIKAETSNSRHHQLANTVLTLGSHLLAEINELLDQSKLEARSLTLAAEPVCLESVLQTVHASVGTQADKKGISFQISLDPRIVDQILSDAHYLSRVLLNVTGNAVKFTDCGHVTLHIALLSETTEEYAIRFTIQDTGIGIPREFIDKIFDPFVQVDTDTAHRYEGTGLGLAISKQVVDLMGGTLLVRSEVGKGSTFWFDLRSPRVRTAPAPTPDIAPPMSSVRYNVLIVDDNDTNRYLLKELIEQLGHQVVTASSGFGALDVLASDAKVDLLFLDYNLGDIDGATVLQLYRFGHTELVPVFFLTADASQLTAERLQNTGARGVLTKPVRTEELCRAIASVAGQPEGAMETTQAPTSLLSELTAEARRPRAVPVVYLDAATIESLRSIGSRPSFVRELLTRANADIADNCNRITNGLAAHDALAVREAAHALKGVCLEVGATRLLNLALALMRYDDSQLTSRSPKLKAELTSVREGTSAALRSIARASEPLESTAGRTAA